MNEQKMDISSSLRSLIDPVRLSVSNYTQWMLIRSSWKVYQRCGWRVTD